MLSNPHEVTHWYPCRAQTWKKGNLNEEAIKALWLDKCVYSRKREHKKQLGLLCLCTYAIIYMCRCLSMARISTKHNTY